MSSEIGVIILGAGLIIYMLWDALWFGDLQKKRVKTTRRGTYTFTPKGEKINE